eukprot:jgi/Mesen1/1959/ME000147S01057
MAYWSPQYGVEPKSWGAYLQKRYSEVFTEWIMCGVCSDCNEEVKRFLLTEYPRLEVFRMAASNASYVTQFVDTRCASPVILSFIRFPLFVSLSLALSPSLKGSLVLHTRLEARWHPCLWRFKHI